MPIFLTATFASNLDLSPKYNHNDPQGQGKQTQNSPVDDESDWALEQLSSALPGNGGSPAPMSK